MKKNRTILLMFLLILLIILAIYFSIQGKENSAITPSNSDIVNSDKGTQNMDDLLNNPTSGSVSGIN